MRKRKISVVLLVIALAMVVLSPVAILPTGSRVASAAYLPNWQEKVDGELLLLARGDLGVAAQVEEHNMHFPRGLPIVVEFGDPPDTSACALELAKDERTACVIDKLTTVAERAQASTQAMLSRQRSVGVVASSAQAGTLPGPQMQTIWISNRLAIWGVTVTEDLLQAIASGDEVTRVYLDMVVPREEPVVQGSVAPEDLDPWHLEDTGLRQVCQETGACGQGILVGLMDTGWDPTHPDLEHLDPCRGTGDHSRCWLDVVTLPPSPVPYDDPWGPHGTHVAGIIGGKKTGGAPKVHLIVAKAFGPWGAGTIQLDQSAQWILEQQVDVVNNSWGAGLRGVFSFFKFSIQAWRNAGIIPVFSAGNSGAEGCGSVRSPGNYLETRLSVAAVGRDGARAYVDRYGERIYFSALGPSPDTFEPRPSITAPGAGVHSTIPFWYDPNGYLSLSGTSMAGPNVVAEVAQLLSGNPQIIRSSNGGIGNLESKLLLSCTPHDEEVTSCWSGVVDGRSVSDDYGFGLLNAPRAAEVLVPRALGEVFGTLTDAGTGDPLGPSVWATVTVMKTKMWYWQWTDVWTFPIRLHADEEGKFSVMLPHDGRYFVEITAFGYTSVEFEVWPVAGERLDISSALERLPHYQVNGTVFADDYPQGGITIVAERTPVQALSGWDDGEWSLLLPSGTYTITGQCSLCLNDTQTVTITSDAVEGVELHLWHISSYTNEVGEAEFEYPPAGAQRICSGLGCWSYKQVDLPWEFPYWESKGVTNTVSSVWATAFGYLTTVDPSEPEEPEPTPTPRPTLSPQEGFGPVATVSSEVEKYPHLGDGVPPHGLIAPFPNGALLPDNIWYWADEEKAVVYWENAKFWFVPHPEGSMWDFEAILYRDGRVEFRYGETANNWFSPHTGPGLEDAVGERVAAMDEDFKPATGTNIFWKMSRSACYRPYSYFFPVIFRRF